MKKVNVPYVAGYYPVKDKNTGEDKILLPVWKKITIVNEKVSRYKNSIHILAKLNKCERLLLEYIIEVMDTEDNFFGNTKMFRRRFIRAMKEWANIDYTETTVQNALVELCKLELILRYGKSQYHVNPIYFFNGSSESRKKLVKQHLEGKL